MPADRGGLQGAIGEEEFWGHGYALMVHIMVMLTALTVLMTHGSYHTYQIVHFKQVLFIVCQLYSNKIIVKKRNRKKHIMIS